jgi:MFS family permease
VAKTKKARLPMLKERFSKRIIIAQRSIIASILLVTNALVWYFYAATTLEEIINKSSQGYLFAFLSWSLHFGAIIFFALASTLFSKRMKNRIRFLDLWMIIGIVLSLVSASVNVSDASSVLLLSTLLGTSFGIGMPSCMGYYSDSTSVENRGRMSGITIFLSGIGISLLGIIPITGVVSRVLVLAVWRLLGLASFALIRQPETNRDERRDASYRSALVNQPLILYLVPWIMFSLVNNLSLPIEFNILGTSLSGFLTSIESGLMGVFAIAGGFLSDFLGRKRVAIIGFVMLGIGYAILGISPENLLGWYFYTIVDGIALGLFFVVFVTTIWGDLSFGKLGDKYYALGLLPFFISKYVQLVLSNYVAKTVSAYAIFSFMAFFLFLAVWPLIYAPETLPEKQIKDRELRQYLEKAKKTKEKYT